MLMIAALAEVECRYENHIDEIIKAHAIELAAANARVVELEAQLPDEMKHCTIQFKECEKGHGWLTATNWVQHGCPTCARQRAEAECVALREALQKAFDLLDNGDHGEGDLSEDDCDICKALHLIRATLATLPAAIEIAPCDDAEFGMKPITMRDVKGGYGDETNPLGSIEPSTISATEFAVKDGNPANRPH